MTRILGRMTFIAFKLLSAGATISSSNYQGNYNAQLALASKLILVDHEKFQVHGRFNPIRCSPTMG